MIEKDAKDTFASGPSYGIVRSLLAGVDPYEQLRAGLLDRSAYCRMIDRGELDRVETHLTRDQLNFSARHCLDEDAFVNLAVRTLYGAGVIGGTAYPREEFFEMREDVRERYEHCDRITHIYPEEEHLLFALSHLVRPSRAVALGAFYGYATLWLLPGIAAGRGRMRLIDTDPEAMDLAERNLIAFGFREIVDLDLVDATRWAPAEVLDLCFVDAEGPKDGVPPELRDKAIYGPILERVSDKIRPGGVLLAHNVLDDDLPRTRYLADRIQSYREQQRHFVEQVGREFDRTVVLPSTEGIGVYRRGPGGIG